MANVLINPVVNAMYGVRELRDALHRLGFRVVAGKADHAGRVRALYADAVARRGSRTVVDMRCPAAAARFRALMGEDGHEYPEIEPILVHCAREVCEDLEDGGDCLVTTPCEILAEYGRSRSVARACFLTWKSFLARHGVDKAMLPPLRTLGPGPIPPGFFKSLPCAVRSLVGAEAISAYGLERRPNPPALLELLDCPGGCLNGDGV